MKLGTHLGYFMVGGSCRGGVHVLVGGQGIVFSTRVITSRISAHFDFWPVA